ncbi:transmembrane protein, putative (macronuclear) [Tetrahymena thermophila SB210]|uniref:Transmembrane protein, putative n=1 Tax=Tetrahymena thermophila (strain SB210) TaxID=312017 RepID=Q22EY9_TETTS|nr:transmembrane protein, putative [Tetrahymena thermophila SB210]EAR83886.2 transmembrane protein, putative [Tetrahymena thermophila SB210]|eukprot:XP_001031549.2 transmembrane protein, putative [Tetrahymena thermophila SB210]
MFNPQVSSNYNSAIKQQQAYQSHQQIQNINQNQGSSYNDGVGIYAGNGQPQQQLQQQQFESQRSQVNVSNMDQNYKLSNMIQKNQSMKLNNSLNQSSYRDKKVLNQNLQQLLTQNSKNKQNSSMQQINKDGNTLSNTAIQANSQPMPEQNSDLVKKLMKKDIKDEKTFSFCTRWTHLTIVFLYSLATVIVSSILVYYFPQNSTNRYYMQETIDNWNQQMWSDIQVVQLTAQQIANKQSPLCPSSYKSLYTVFGLPISDGCNCLSSTYSQKAMIVGKCGDDQIASGCTNVKGFDPPVGFNWQTPDGSVTFTLCVKLIDGLTYNNVGSQTNCQKTCGGSTPETQICVNSNQDCPINYIRFGSAPDATQNIQNLKSQAIGASYNMYYSSSGSGAPLVDVRLTKGIGVCMNNNIQNLYQQPSYYPLLNVNQTQVCSQSSQIDTRFTSILTLNEKSLYQINYFDNQYTALPGYTLSTTELYSIYVRPAIVFAQDRRGSDISTFMNSYQNYDTVYNGSVSILVTSIFYLVCIGLIYNIFSILNILNKKHLYKQYLYDLEPDLETQKSHLFKRLWLKILISLAHMISILVTFVLTIQNYLYLTTLNQGTLGDQYTQNLVSSLKSEYYTNILWYIVSNFIVFSTIVIIELLALVPLLSKKLKEDTKVKISSKYMPKPGSSKAQQQQIDSNNKRGLELPEYQTHNMYGGNGINTTINPFVQHLSVLGADITTANNRSIHMGPGLYTLQSRNNQANQGINSRQATQQLNYSNILPPEIKNYESMTYNNKNTQGNEQKLQMTNQMTTTQQTDQQEIIKKSPHQPSQYASNRVIEAMTAGSQSGLPTGATQNDRNMQIRNSDYVQEYQKQSSNQISSNFNSRNINHMERNQQNGDEQNQTIDLDFHSNHIVIQQPAAMNQFNDSNVSNDFGGLSNNFQGDKKNRQSKYSIESLPGQFNKQNEYANKIQTIPEVDSHRQYIGQDRTSNNDSNNMNNFNNNNFQIKSGSKLDQQQYNPNNYSQNNAISQNQYSSGNFNNMNRIPEDDNNHSNTTINEHQGDNRIQKVKNTGFNANQKHNNQENANSFRNQQNYNMDKNDFNSQQNYYEANNHNNNKNFNNNHRNSNYNNINQQSNQNDNSNYFNNQRQNQYNIYQNNQPYNQEMFQAQNRIHDKNDQDVDDPDMYDINLPAYNQKFY